MEIIRTSGVRTAGHAVAFALLALRSFSRGGKQYGFAVINRVNRALTGRSAHLGLSFVRLWSVGHCRGAANCRHRAAPHWPSMKGACIQSEAHPSMTLQPVQSIFDTVQRARHCAERGTRRAGQGGHVARLKHCSHIYLPCGSAFWRGADAERRTAGSTAHRMMRKASAVNKVRIAAPSQRRYSSPQSPMRRYRSCDRARIA